MSENPARTASRRSVHIVETRPENAKQQWLELFADDAIVEDPVGRSPLDPQGSGHRGKQEIGAFWDRTIAPVRVKFELRDSYACGDEVANVAKISTTLPDGSRFRTEGVFVYRVDAAGKIVSLRAFWEFDRMGASVEKSG
ncbi:MAG: nuclear transport factor 2 family protein [Deltaproteobacteria bacterium]|nr:nuclear transport factor 2 family protein [Deltaproteobacteria bacterium]